MDADNSGTTSMVFPDGTQVQIGATNYQYVISRDRKIGTAINNAEVFNGTGLNGLSGPILDLGEYLYNGDLKLVETPDDFGRPSNEWSYEVVILISDAAELSGVSDSSLLYIISQADVIKDGSDTVRVMKAIVDGVWKQIETTDTVQLTDPMLYDRLRTLSAEYDLSVESLVNAAVKRFVDEIDFVRNLQTGKTGGA